MEKNEKRQISDPYLCAYLFLNLKTKPKPVVEQGGRVSFEFPNDEQLEEAIEAFHKDARVNAFAYSGAIKAIKSIIFALKQR